MRLSQSFFPTLKEIPSDAQIPSHQLMMRAGLMRPLAAGIYSFLPLGFRVLQKIMNIIREEMNAIGGQEFHLPALNPIELWEETGRVKAFGDILFQIKNRPLVLAPTHEEIICHIAKNHIKSYKELPQIWYQIQTKFRNEPRPRSGVLRGRQFTMKDAYSLDYTWEGLDKSYALHEEAYKKIFTRCGLKFFIVGASSGAMGGSGSQEFLLESAEGGEDSAVVCDNCGYAANLEVAVSNAPRVERLPESKKREQLFTPNIKTIKQLSEFLRVETTRLAKSLVYNVAGKPTLILMCGTDQLNEAKLMRELGGEFRAYSDEELFDLTGADAGSIGPIGLKNFQIIADKRLEQSNELISGANKNDFHIAHIDLERDISVSKYADLRIVETGELCTHCGKELRIINAIELGHIFKLGTKYADAMHATVLNEEGKELPIIMGSYGIGVERIAACHIEQNHDVNGIIWDKALAPFLVHLISVNAENENVIVASNKLYEQLTSEKIEVIFDDRVGVSPGFKFKDADLLGMPLQLIVGDRNLKQGNVEIKIRKTGERTILPVEKAYDFIAKF
ncbi:MAG: proline--tRNA ligase [Ignavibacteriales bacterium]|nr:proline--tRNA ligase [Ignavibacteriales bacterium]